MPGVTDAHADASADSSDGGFEDAIKRYAKWMKGSQSYYLIRTTTERVSCVHPQRLGFLSLGLIRSDE